MSFDTLAPHYRWMEFFLAGEKLQRCRTAFLDEIPVPGKILLVGEGHGRCLEECCKRFSEAEITCVDASEKMLETSRRALNREKSRLRSVHFIHADILQLELPSAEWDLVITNFFLDCFRPEQLEQIVSKIGNATAPNANWLLADFQSAARGWKKIRSRMILGTMYFFFRAITRLPARKLTAPNSFLEQAGFTLRRSIESEWDLLHADWWVRK